MFWIYYVAKFFGIFPFVYNRYNNQFDHSSVTYVISNIFFLVFLSIYPCMFYVLYLRTNLIYASRLLEYISIAKYITSYSQLMCTYILKMLTPNDSRRLLNQFLKLNKHFDHLWMKKSTLWIKVKLTTLVLYFTYYIYICGFAVVNLSSLQLFAFLYTIALNVFAYLVLTTFFYGLLEIYNMIVKLESRIPILNSCLQHPTNQINWISHNCKVSDELDRLSKLYRKVFELSCRLNRFFDRELFLHFTNLFMCVVMEYIFLFFVDFNVLDPSEKSAIEASQVALILYIVICIIFVLFHFLEYYFFTKICEDITLRSRKIRYSLAKMFIQNNVDKRLGESVSL